MAVWLRALTIVSLVPNNTAYNTNDFNFRESGAFSRLYTHAHTHMHIPPHMHITRKLMLMIQPGPDTQTLSPS